MVEELSYVIYFNETAIKRSINPIVLIVQLAGTPFRMIPQILFMHTLCARPWKALNEYICLTYELT